jgi:hypothetical protein
MHTKVLSTRCSYDLRMAVQRHKISYVRVFVEIRMMYPCVVCKQSTLTEKTKRRRCTPIIATTADEIINGALILDFAESQTVVQIDKAARVFGGTVILPPMYMRMLI